MTPSLQLSLKSTIFVYENGLELRNQFVYNAINSLSKMKMCMIVLLSDNGALFGLAAVRIWSSQDRATPLVYLEWVRLICTKHWYYPARWMKVTTSTSNEYSKYISMNFVSPKENKWFTEYFNEFIDISEKTLIPYWKHHTMGQLLKRRCQMVHRWNANAWSVTYANVNNVHWPCEDMHF